MRKRIICIALLSLLIGGVFAGSASATTTYYYKLTGMTASPSTITASTYTTSFATDNKSTITLTADVKDFSKAADATAAGYTAVGTPPTITYATTAASGSGNIGTIATNGKLSPEKFSNTAKTITFKFKNNVTGAGKITVKAAQGSGKDAPSVTCDVNVVIPAKTAPTVSGDVSIPTATAGTDLTAATAKVNTINLVNCPEKIKVWFEGTTASGDAANDTTKDITYLGVKATIEKVAVATDGTKVRTVKLSGTPGFATDSNGINIVITASNSAGELKKTYNLKVNAIKPDKFTTKPAKKDLGEVLNSTSKVIGAETELTTADQNKLKFEITTATLPVTITATGLPDGLVISQSAGLDAAQNATTGTNAGKGTATAVIKGTPTKAGTYKITVKAENAAGSCESKDLTLTVLEKPEFTTRTLPELTWGKPYSTTLKGTGAIAKYPISFDIVAAEFKKLPKGLSLDKNSGVLKGTFTSPDSKVAGEFSFDVEGERKINVTFRVRNALTITEKSFDIKVRAVKPTIQKQGTMQNTLDKMKLSFDHSFTLLLSADGPGVVSWDVPTLPPGITSSESRPDPKKAVTVLKLTGKPQITTRNFNAKVSPYNGAGMTSFTLKFNIDYPSVDITAGTIASPQSVDVVLDPAVAFTAKPGPIVWSAKNLPAGLKLSIDKSVSYDRKVYVTGTFKSATKIDKNGQSVYTITAKNTVTGKTDTYSADLKVYALPKITTTTLPKLTTGKNYTAKIVGTGSTVSSDMKWTVKLENDPDATALPAKKKALPSIKGALSGAGSVSYYVDSSDGAVKVATATTKAAKLTVSMDMKTGMPIIVGSLDALPTYNATKKRNAILVTVSLKTPYGESVDKFLSLDVSGVAPKFTTAKIDDFITTQDGSADIIATGTLPITMSAYIDKSAAKTFFGKDGNTPIPLDGEDGETEGTADATTGGFSFKPSKDGKGVLKFTKDLKVAFKGLPITFTVQNGAMAKPVVKVMKVNVKGEGIYLIDGKTEAIASPDITIFVNAGGDVSESFELSGDTVPFEVTSSLKEGKTQNGISATIDPPTGKVTISGTVTSGKETKTPITLTAKNKSTNDKHTVKLTIIGQAAPEITTKAQTKEIEAGRNFNLKIQAKGSKMAVSKATGEARSDRRYVTKDVKYNPIKWEIDESGTNKTEDLVRLGLSFDASSGTFKGTAISTTSADGAYSPYTFTVKAINDAAGSSEAPTVDITIGVKGRKMKFTNAPIIINKNASANNYFLSSPDMMLKTNMASDDENEHVRFSWADSNYSNYGLGDTITPAGIGTDGGNYGQLAGDFSDVPATKGATLRISAENIGTTLNGTIKLVVNDKDPEIDGSKTFEIQAESGANVVDTMEFTLKDPDTMLTGDTRMKWTLSQRSTNPKLTVTLKPAADGSSAVATLTAQKTTSSKDITAVFTVAVQNTMTRVFAYHKVSVDVKGVTDTSARPADKDALPEEKLEEKAEESVEETLEAETETVSEDVESEGTVSYGDARTEEWLTADERAAIAEAGYVIAAILPEITADADGQYDLEAVTLSENAPEGESLVWFAFPRNAEKSDDDTIAEFYDEAGAEITAVPESRNVIASPWLRKDVTYAPVIAVKAPVTYETKESLDEAEEGDTVTLEALEEATENVSEDEAPAEETSADEKPAEEIPAEEAHTEEAPVEE